MIAFHGVSSFIGSQRVLDGESDACNERANGGASPLCPAASKVTA